MGLVPFLRWPSRVNQLQFEHEYREKVKVERGKLNMVIEAYQEAGKR